MNKLIQIIEVIQQKLPNYRRHLLKETPTRTIVIDPLLEALGWDVRDPEEVELEYPTVDGKSVDYALKINKKPVLLLEAKSLNDSLDDVKAVTQIVSYAANDGIVWCILTNGIKWRVYRSIEKCQAPEKLMFEVCLDPAESEGMSIQQIANQMWRFSREEMAKGTLDALGEQTFTDGKVRKSLQNLMNDPPRTLLNIIKTAVNDETLTNQRIKESLARIGNEIFASELCRSFANINHTGYCQSPRTFVTKKTHEIQRAKKGESPYGEAHHITGKSQEIISLYRSVERLCLSFMPEEISLRYLAKYIAFDYRNRCFCSICLQGNGLRVWLKLKYNHIENPPSFARDVSHVGHWGTGDVELRITNHAELDEAAILIRRSFDSVQ